MKAVAQAANDPEFKEKATGVFAPLRYLSPADFDRVIKEAEVGFRQLWKELLGATSNWAACRLPASGVARP